MESNQIAISDMKISFVIPAYNEEECLGKCLDSVIKEAGRADCAYEIIVVNNASTDKTREVALAYSGIKVADEPHKGLSQARQTGFLASAGDLIANIDADTMLPMGWINTVLKAFAGDPLLIAISGPHVFYDVSWLTAALIKIYYYLAFFVYWLNRFVFRSGSMLQGGNFVVKKSALITVGGYNPQFEFYGEDTDIAKRLHGAGKVKFTLGLPIFASGRRLMKEGLFKMAIRYPLNYFWATFFGKPFTKTFIDVRNPKK